VKKTIGIIGLLATCGFVYWISMSILRLNDRPKIPNNTIIEVMTHVVDATTITGTVDSTTGLHEVKMVVDVIGQMTELFAKLTEEQYLQMRSVGGDFMLRGRPVHLTLRLNGREWIVIGIGFEEIDGNIKWIGSYIGKRG
jgi:hypothetical protein